MDTGELRLLFCRRLGDSWSDLAIVSGLTAADWRRFPRGREAAAIWDWLQDRSRLTELPDALRLVGRTDLAERFAGAELGAANGGAALADGSSGPTVDVAAVAERDWLNQARFDALVAKHLHGRCLARRRRSTRLLDGAALLCCAGAVGGGWVVQPAAVASAAGLAAALILARLSVDRPDRTVQHAALRSQNLRLASEIQEVLRRRDRDPVQLAVVRRMQERLDEEDGAVLGDVSAARARHAFRLALSEAYDGATATCPECGASPQHRPKWYVRDRCRVCGNAPAHQDSTPIPTAEVQRQ